jgi:D-tyrosyl-tRNA(Tyr) deacylase
VARRDVEPDADRLAHRTARLRVFPDADGRFACSLLDTAGGALVVPNFTLAADTRRGHRPSFTDAAEPGRAEALYERYVRALRHAGVAAVATGRFGAAMQVALVGTVPSRSCSTAPRRPVRAQALIPFRRSRRVRVRVRFGGRAGACLFFSPEVRGLQAVGRRPRTDHRRGGTDAT